jgi:hypothetical protein
VIDVKDIPIRKKRVRPVKLQGDFESRRLWQHVTNALKVGDMNTASEHKKVVGFILEVVYFVKVGQFL